MSSKVQASLAAVEAAASEQRRYFHVHKPDAPVTTVPWRDAWVHHEKCRNITGEQLARDGPLWALYETQAMTDFVRDALSMDEYYVVDNVSLSPS